MKTLCLYYSRTGRTRSVMERLAQLLDADLYEYTDGRDRSGVRGYLVSCVDSFKRAPEVRIVGGEPDWDEYDKVIVAMPTWSETPCVIGKGFLRQYSGKFRGDLYLVVTHMAKTDYDKAIRKAYRYSSVAPKAHLSLQTKNHDTGVEIRDFVKSLR